MQYEMFVAGGSIMEAARKLDNRVEDSRHISRKPGRIIQMAPYFERRGMRVPFDNKRMQPLEIVPGGKKESANLLALLANILDSVTLPEIFTGYIRMLDERIRSKKATAAFVKADAEFDEIEFNKLLAEEANHVPGKPIQDSREHSSDGSAKYEKERTRRLISLTGGTDGDIEDVLVWET